MKLLFAILGLASATFANSQDLTSLQFDKIESMIGEKVDSSNFYRFEVEDRKKYLRAVFPYNVSYRAKNDSFSYNNFKAEGPWLCISNNRFQQLYF